MTEEVKSLIDFAATLVEVLALLVGNFAPAAPLVKLVLCSIALTSVTWRYLNNRKLMKEMQHVEPQ